MVNVQSKRCGMAILMAALVAVLGVACALALPAQTAYAGIFLSESNSWVVAPNEDDNVHSSSYISFMDENGFLLDDDEVKITNLKSSNKKVARVSKDFGVRIEYGTTIGKSIISFKANGKEFSHVFEVRYTCPVTLFKVAGKSVLKTFKTKNIFVTKQTLKNKVVKVRTKKNWVITNVILVKKNSYKEKSFKGKRSYSAKISTIEPYDGITLEFKNKKTGEEQTLKYRKYYDIRYAVAG